MAVQFQGFSGVPQLVSGPITKDPASCGAAAVTQITLTVPGATPDMHFIVTAPSLAANLGIVGAFCTTAGSVIVNIINPTAAPIDDVSQSFYLIGL